ncbi:FimV/HubP family polar landmark protein [Pseudomonas sp. CAU 1711]|uniref:FimV/HubP family polar landmark protein n=1 Tax=Pseudomonas sp. CAU 1711 TaxID=3140356 RepID=UPI0032607676
MARMRQLLLTLASGSAFYSGLVPALGLGEISLHSALNQPLDADIELLQIGDLETDEIKVRLASAEDFTRSGVERFYFLNDLRFTPLLQGGRGLIRVTSGKPVREPYLNFIVEVARPGGSLLREYTVLIDPPGSAAFSPRTSAEPARAVAPPRQAPARPQPVAKRGERYRVQTGDSLWRIAGQLQAGGSAAGREALMADIHALNPQAFAGGDPNRLRAGVELLLPDSALAATPQPAAAVESGGAALEPVAQASAQEPAAAQIEAQQRRVDAELAEANAQNRELQSALGDLQSQLAQLQAQMAEKDRQLQQIRADLQRRPLDSAPLASTEPRQQKAAAAPAEARSDWGLWLLGGLLVLTLLLAAVLFSRRRVVPREAEVLRRSTPLPEPRSEVRIISQAQASAEPEPELESESEVEIAPAAVVRPAPERQPAGAADPLEEANIYIAYGRFADAANVLRKALGQQPERLDLRLRLYEVCGEQGEAAAFFELERELREMGASHAQLDQIRARYSGLQRPQEDALADAVLQLDEPEPEPPLQEEFQLNLDDLSLDADWDLANVFQPEQPARIKRAQEEGVEPAFSSDLEQLPEVQEVDADKEMLESFADLPHPHEEVLVEEFVDAFSREPVGRSNPQPTQANPLDSDLDHLAGSREHLVKLNMALAYIEQGDIGSACDILNELVSVGDAQQRERARELLAKIA